MSLLIRYHTSSLWGKREWELRVGSGYYAALHYRFSDRVPIRGKQTLFKARYKALHTQQELQW